jgi:hypothetical protein
MVLAVRDLGLSPDGVVRKLVTARFLDASGAPTEILAGGDVAFVPDSTAARAQWQTRLRFGGPAAIVSFAAPAVATVTVRANVGPPVPAARIRIDARPTRPLATAGVLGPRTVQLAWFPAAAGDTVRIVRTGGNGPPTLALVAAPAATYRDTSVLPGRRYCYAIRFGGGRPPATLAAATPPEPRGAPLGRIAGKKMWLSFSPSPRDPNGYDTLDAAATVAQARAAGIRAIELRVAYGPFWEITDAARPAVDALLDAAAASGIAVIAWTVPRSTAFEDLATAERAASYRTARGTRFAALALDLERGDDFLGSGPAGFAALASYAGSVRAALGPRYPLVATVEDPFLEHLGANDVPYPAIAASVDVLQPMAYWRMLSRKAVTPEAVRAALRGSYAAARAAAGRPIAIDLGGQTAGEGPRGAPPPAEIAAAVAQARRLGAFGITFFDWDGTSGAQWAALARARW